MDRCRPTTGSGTTRLTLYDRAMRVGGEADEATGRGSTLGTLGLALARLQARVQTLTVAVTTVVAIALAAMILPAVAVALNGAIGPVGALLIAGVAGWLIFVVAVGVVAFMPPLLLPGRDRAVSAAHAWIGAREVRRLLGNPARAMSLPRDRATAERWLARHPATDANRPIRVDALLMAGRYDDARRETELLPERTPLEAYRKTEARALIEDQTGGPVDEAALRLAVASVPAGIDRTEAAVSLAVFRARRLLPHGDWRAPLADVRPLIPGSDARILIEDFGLPIFELLFRRAVVPFTVLLVLIAASVTIVPAVLD